MISVRSCLLAFELLFVKHCCCWASPVPISSETVPCCHGLSTIRYHYGETTDGSCRDLFLIVGVGTAMNTDSYDLIAGAIIEQTPQLVVLTLDAEPYIPVKQGPKPFARAVDALSVEMGDLIPNISVCSSPLTIVVGGHSASGAAAFHALRLEYFLTPIAGYLGLDPFLIQGGKKSPQFIASWWQERIVLPTSKQQLTIPSVDWGFAETTCSVSVAHAALAAYNQTQLHRRVFYQLHPPFSHCCFADEGCFRICKCGTPTQHLHHDVGISVNHLFRHIFSGNSDFVPSDFQGNDFHLDSSSYKAIIDDTKQKSSESVDSGSLDVVVDFQ